MATSNYGPIYGSDNHQPIQDDNAPWRMWGLSDVYFGGVAKARYVPKVKDYVIKPETFETWIVTSVDPITLIPTLLPIRPFGTSSELSKEDILFGVGPGTQAQLLRIYINRTNFPHRMTVDTHCFVGGSKMAYAVIYKGGDPTMGGEPVSRMYDNSGNYLGPEVPLEMVALDSHVNHAIKIVSECWCNEDIPDGEPLYVVFYTADGMPASKAMLLAENTTYIRGLDIQRKTVVGISLESPWLTASDSNVLKFPLNIPRDALDLVGVVNYNDGTKLRLPVDNRKFTMAGLDGYISSIPGEKFDLSLIYQLSKDEVSYAGQGMYVNRSVTAPYSVITETVEPGYTVKLFMYPFWNSATRKYRLRFWLYNLARNSYVEVTDNVTYSVEQGAFVPDLYGVKQRMQVNLNLRNVSMNYKPMIHTQMFEVTLFGIPADSDTPWIVNNSMAPTMPGFGVQIYCKIKGTGRYTLESGYTSKEDWIKAFYSNTNPLVDARSEASAPIPTHFWTSFDSGATWTQYFLDTSWNAVLSTNKSLVASGSVLIRFTRPVLTQTADLAISAATIKA